MEDVAGGIQESQAGEPTAEFEEDPAHAAEEPGALEAEVLSIPNSRARLAEHPAEREAARRSARQCRRALRSASPRRLLSWQVRGFPVRRYDPVGQPPDRPQEQERVVVQREALEFQLVRTALAEAFQVLPIASGEGGRPLHFLENGVQRAVAESFHEGRAAARRSLPSPACAAPARR